MSYEHLREFLDEAATGREPSAVDLALLPGWRTKGQPWKTAVLAAARTCKRHHDDGEAGTARWYAAVLARRLAGQANEDKKSQVGKESEQV